MAKPDHRHPPLPHWNSGKGFCRWCGQPVTKPNGEQNMRALWHKHCLPLYLVATRPKNQRDAAYKAYKGKCAQCGTKHVRRSTDWQADHIFPLHLADRKMEWEKLIEMWLPGNLQLLCSNPCHREKSASEMRAYHANRKAQLNQAKDQP